MFVHQQIQKYSKLRLQTDDAERRGIELNFLFKLRMRRVIRRQDRQGAVRDSFQKRIDIALRAQRRIDFEISVEALDGLVGQGDMVRTNFAADLDATPAR